MHLDFRTEAEVDGNADRILPLLWSSPLTCWLRPLRWVLLLLDGDRPCCFWTLFTARMISPPCLSEFFYCFGGGGRSRRTPGGSETLLPNCLNEFAEHRS